MSSGYAVAVLVGLGIAAQVAIVGRAASTSHPLAVSFALQLAGVAVAGAWATITASWADVLTAARQPWWIPLGVGGWIVVAALGYAANRVGVAAVLALSVGAQLLAGLVIDATMGTSILASRSFLGVLLVVSGAVLVTTSS